jgi:hypothetical protein
MVRCSSVVSSDNPGLVVERLPIGARGREQIPRKLHPDEALAYIVNYVNAIASAAPF